MENVKPLFFWFYLVYKLTFTLLLVFTNVGHFFPFRVILKTLKEKYYLANVLHNSEFSQYQFNYSLDKYFVSSSFSLYHKTTVKLWSSVWSF